MGKARREYEMTPTKKVAIFILMVIVISCWDTFYKFLKQVNDVVFGTAIEVFRIFIEYPTVTLLLILAIAVITVLIKRQQC